MNYKKISGKIDIKFNKKFKYIMSVFCLLILIFIGFTKPILASSSCDNSKMLFHVKILNYAFPTIEAANKDKSQENVGIKRRILEGLGIDISSPSSILKKEMAMFKENKNGETKKAQENKTGDELYDENGNLVLNPFKLDEEEIAKVEKPKDMEKNKVVSIYNPKLKKKLNVNKPEVFIYHTHTHESYKPGKVSSSDQKVNVCAVGDMITNELMKNYGVSVIHDKTIHDSVYPQCYSRSSKTVDKYLKKYGGFKLIIDLHRDSCGNKKAVTSKINGEDVARIMFVADLSNPKLKSTMGTIDSLKSIINKICPTLMRSKSIYTYNHGKGHFNQHKSNNSVLIEAGSYVNTTDEAKRTGKYLARVIAEYLNK
ncbi:stage II sporulation protein P [Haloimpatiens sp. FM7330]|uniref:stage II sporulation protein P n=1 Tax=Haloimpatiens sp. FM7330 TaxID=3298610 RepID=UPI003631FA1E